MEGLIKSLLLRYGRKTIKGQPPTTLILELLQAAPGEVVETYREGVFRYSVKKLDAVRFYEFFPEFLTHENEALRRTVGKVSQELSPESVEPLTFETLVGTLSQASAAEIGRDRRIGRVRDLSLLAAFEAIGIPTILGLAMDKFVTEFYIDSDSSPVYLDHSKYGRCESSIYFTERERKAIETHLDTFKGYTLDFSTPSLKNELQICGSRLRISLDLAPLAVNSFSLDVRKLSSSALSLADLLVMDVLSPEAAAFLLVSLESGMNLTIVGETGTGKTTLLNALDEALNPQLRRIYIEDAVETKDLIERGYHQMKLRVDPFEKAAEASRTKAEEIVKILHRSPDLVILGEVQSSEHSRAFFHALSSGVRGMQTFHSSSPEQAIRRWREIHEVSKASLLDLDLIVQMVRPVRLSSARYVSRISQMMVEEGDARLVDVYSRSRDTTLHRTVPWEALQLRRSTIPGSKFVEGILAAQSRLETEMMKAELK